MEGLQFINWDDPMNRWKLDDVLMIATKIKEYATAHDLKGVELHKVTDNRWEDKENQRFDVEIRYTDENDVLWQQKLLILKGEVIDGKTFHERSREFYQRKQSN